ncbi:acyl-CoA dehydrogenase family protein [Comamonas endophytica]|uniref:Acyl-CoA dehydrogenase family protein n=1 Tax=Comamonas endophytica TaxID=2949090 RepID=A0ABY6GHC7_9BURK|nr:MULTISPECIES: acyl-CoA dehydrogenase family protein [unclassified Acidovorax]MCD2513451.1 acyl-CoA dehydrogenase family protein [Acidovorax sp. D4N7]UYG53767.1 acyl-CoA dehydrogenase family protein [Acidovorax sp. 5MLIR]
MNFEPTEDRRMLADTLERFVTEQYGFETRNAIAYGDVGMAPALWGQFAELGAIGALFTEADGGFGGAGFDIAVVFEALGRGLVVEPFLGALMVGRALAAAGTPAQKERLAGLIDGSTVAALAHDEPGSHYELNRVATRAERNGEGWALSGAKAVVVQGDHADLLLVSARTAGAMDGEDGISLFLVPGNAPGVTRRGMGRIDGGRVAEITLDQVQLPGDSLLGGEGRGLQTLEIAIGAGVLALCAEALGAMEIAKRDTLEYLRTRKQFGVAIGSFQALQHRMADLLLEIEQARSAVINAAAALDADRLTRERALSAAKFSIGRIGALVAEESIQMHGGIGMTWELPLSHYAKRLVMIDHELGDEDHHLARFMALGRESVQ